MPVGTAEEDDLTTDKVRRFDGGGADVDAIVLPAVEDGQLTQDTEWCEVSMNGRRERVRFHDYGRIFDVPGLYERIFYDILGCNSPRRVVRLLDEVLEDFDGDDPLRVIDVGAGNGVVGEELSVLEPQHIVGLDILEEAEQAARRDRPHVYDDYVVADLADLPAPTAAALHAADFNCLVSVATLGFNDIPPEAFAAAADFVDAPGWLAFNLKEDFLQEAETSGFGRFIHRLQQAGVIQIHAYRRYRHRLSISGEPLHYVAMVARKLRDIPRCFVDEAREYRPVNAADAPLPA